jgi:2-dehydro-3-deoxy-D-arabinonate dehydratase
MRFLRCLADREASFGVETEGGHLRRLDTMPGGPSSYLELYELALAAGQTVTDFVSAQLNQAAALPWPVDALDVAPNPARPHLLLPYVPPEVWGAAFSYPARPGVPDPYADVRHGGRPVVFFKATPHRCVGPNDAVGSRGDATAMIPEPELGLVLDAAGGVIGYTIVNDVSSRDLPQAHPLFVCYSKTFDRCVSLGPAVVPPEAVADPLDLSVRCRVTRGAAVLWDETSTTRLMTRTLRDLIHYTVDHNRVPLGTLLATGSVMSPPRGMHLAEGDMVEIIIPMLGRLANPVILV